MSWEILLLNVPDHIKAASDLQADSIVPLGTRNSILEVLRCAFSDLDTSDSHWLILVRKDYSLRFSMTHSEPIEALLVTIHGTIEAIQELERLCIISGWRAFDSASGEFLQFTESQ